MAYSRRALLGSHLRRPGRVARCPICQWAISEDHDEALLMNGVLTRAQELLHEADSESSLSEEPEPEAVGASNGG